MPPSLIENRTSGGGKGGTSWAGVGYNIGESSTTSDCEEVKRISFICGKLEWVKTRGIITITVTEKKTRRNTDRQGF